MSLEDDIMARILAARAWDKDTRLEDFQLRVSANGSVLVNLKTGRSYLIYDEFSEMQEPKDLQELFPNLLFLPKRAGSR